MEIDLSKVPSFIEYCILHNLPTIYEGAKLCAYELMILSREDDKMDIVLMAYDKPVCILKGVWSFEATHTKTYFFNGRLYVKLDDNSSVLCKLNECGDRRVIIEYAFSLDYYLFCCRMGTR